MPLWQSLWLTRACHSLRDTVIKYLGIALTLIFTMAWFTAALSKEPARDSGNASEAAQKTETPPADQPSLGEARRQAATLHTAMHAALQVVHHRYYREDQGLPIPASVLKDVFTEIEDEQQIKLRWLVVEGQAMNTDHKPQDAFEKEAVDALKSGKREFERSENGFYRRAGAITLTSHCLKCHVPDRKNTKDRTAGLLISISVKRIEQKIGHRKAPDGGRVQGQFHANHFFGDVPGRAGGDDAPCGG